MRLRNVKNAYEDLTKSSYFINNPKENKGKWKRIFQNENPIHLEIGMGKGQFLINMAKAYPHINFIGMEKFASVLIRAIKKVEEEELSNIRFICEDAKNIEDFFDKEITTLYLNFSDPWPKTRHAKRRLTSPEFLKSYDTIFLKDGHIIQKTDNILLFAYSLEQLSKHGYILEKVSLDLANTNIFNIKTEYEEKFSSLGYKIHYVEARKKNTNKASIL